MIIVYVKCPKCGIDARKIKELQKTNAVMVRKTTHPDYLKHITNSGMRKGTSIIVRDNGKIIEDLRSWNM